MGYTTEFYGGILVDPPLNQQEMDFLCKFSNTRRMDRKKGPYFVDGTGLRGQDHEDDIIDYNNPPDGQPSLWCQWIPTDNNYIVWDQGEKFYAADKWMEYIIEHFIGSDPIAKLQLPFLQGHVCNGEIEAYGEDHDDIWLLRVVDNKITVHSGRITYN